MVALGLIAAAGATAQPGGTSIGNTRRGRLVGGVELPEDGNGFRFESVRGNPQARYGTPALVQSLLSAIDRVNTAAPGGTLVVEDLSNPGGGSIPGHGSHASGRDVDLRYYAVDGAGQPLDPRRVSYGADGLAVDGGPERLDIPRNWLLIEALLEGRAARVRYIFAAPWIERLLIAHARERSSAQTVRAASIRIRPPGTRGASPHDDHLHVRIECPPTDVPFGCRP